MKTALSKSRDWHSSLASAVLVLATLGAHGIARAADFGALRPVSLPGAPFVAELELRLQPGEIDTLMVRSADRLAYTRAGLEYGGIAEDLRVRIRVRDGQYYALLTSNTVPTSSSVPLILEASTAYGVSSRRFSAPLASIPKKIDTEVVASVAARIRQTGPVADQASPPLDVGSKADRAKNEAVVPDNIKPVTNPAVVGARDERRHPDAVVQQPNTRASAVADASTVKKHVDVKREEIASAPSTSPADGAKSPPAGTGSTKFASSEAGVGLKRDIESPAKLGSESDRPVLVPPEVKQTARRVASVIKVEDDVTRSSEPAKASAKTVLPPSLPLPGAAGVNAVNVVAVGDSGQAKSPASISEPARPTNASKADDKQKSSADVATKASVPDSRLTDHQGEAAAKAHEGRLSAPSSLASSVSVPAVPVLPPVALPSGGNGGQSGVMSNTPLPSAAGLPPVVTIKAKPARSPYGQIAETGERPDESEIARVSGHGTRMPLGKALGMIVPQGWRGFTSDSAVKNAGAVDWDAQDVPWPLILGEVLASRQISATINWTSKEIEFASIVPVDMVESQSDEVKSADSGINETVTMRTPTIASVSGDKSSHSRKSTTKVDEASVIAGLRRVKIDGLGSGADEKTVSSLGVNVNLMTAISQVAPEGWLVISRDRKLSEATVVGWNGRDRSWLTVLDEMLSRTRLAATVNAERHEIELFTVSQ